MMSNGPDGWSEADGDGDNDTKVKIDALNIG